MEKITKTGKVFEDTLNEILEENGLTRDEVIYTTGEVKKGLFKGETTEVIVYKKEDVYNLAKEFLKEMINNLGLDVSFEVKKAEDRTIIKMYSENNSILIGHNGNTLKAFETLVRQKIQLETGIYFVISLDVENYKEKYKYHQMILNKQLPLTIGGGIGEVGSERITKDFLEKILDRKIDKIDLSKNPILRRKYQDDKLGILDILVELNGKEQCNIELQIIDQKNIIDRMLFYWSRLYSGQLKAGDNYKETQKTIVILISDFKIDGLEELNYLSKWKI